MTFGRICLLLGLSMSACAADLQGLLEAYAPGYWFHSIEQIFPVNIERMLRDPDYPVKGLRRQCTSGLLRMTYVTPKDKAEIPAHLATLYGHINDGKALGIAGQTRKGYTLTYFLYYHYDVASRFVNDFNKYGDFEHVQVTLEWAEENGVRYLKPVSLRTEAHGNEVIYGWDRNELLLQPSGVMDERGVEIKYPEVFVARDSHGTYPNPAIRRAYRDYPTDPSEPNRVCDERGISINDPADLRARQFCDYIVGRREGGVEKRFPITAIKVVRDSKNELLFNYIQQKNPLGGGASGRPGGSGGSTGPQLPAIVPYLTANEYCTPEQEGKYFPKLGSARRWGNLQNAHGLPASGTTSVRDKDVWDNVI